MLTNNRLFPPLASCLPSTVCDLLTVANILKVDV